MRTALGIGGRSVVVGSGGPRVRRSPGGAVLSLFLLVASTALGDASAPRPGPAGDRVPLVAWWEREPVASRIGLDAEQRKALAADLGNLQTSYQIVQTRLSDARAKQARMLLDPAAGEDEIRALHRESVARLSDELQELNLAARLLVRKRLSAAQMSLVAKELPGFFTARWFRTSPVRVEQGKVVKTK